MDRASLLAAGNRPLTYCTNVHPTNDLESAESVLRDTVADTLHRNLGPGRCLLGAWWPADVADALASDPDRLARHGQLLDELDLIPASLNVFPAGRFHGDRVKEAVYEPDWSSPDRLRYTLAAANACADLLAPRGFDRAVMSTVPLGFRGVDRSCRSEPAMVENIFRAALALEDLAARSGVEIILALEPEPWCILESIGELIEWFEDAALPLAATHGNEAAMRRHVGICIDLCHAAVVGEDPVEALREVRRAGIRVGKIQLSAAVVATGKRGRDALIQGYDEPVYLHQTWSRVPGLGPFLDLSDPGLAAADLADDAELVSHFHVPLHWHADETLRSTQDEVLRFLDALEESPDLLQESVPLEVETYTNPGIADELAYVVRRLLGRPLG